jgi:glycosyltransferase involved in cell wall biosynthesis
MPSLSIISTCFNEKENVEECYKIIKKIMIKNNIDYEHIFADNSSTDGSVNILKQICKNDKSVKLIINSRNYGPFLNNFNALKHASGEYIIVNYASDMQDPAEKIIDMFNEIKKGYDIVYGQKIDTEDNFILKNLRKIFYYFVNQFSDNFYPPNVNEFMCIKNNILKKLDKVDDFFPYIRGYVARTSNNYAILKFKRKNRKLGKTKNSFFDLYAQAMNGLIFTMDKLIRVIGLFFLVLSLISLVFLISNIITKLLYPGLAPKGITLLIALITLFFSLTSFLMSIILEYVLAIHNQVRGNMGVNIKEKINF